MSLLRTLAGALAVGALTLVLTSGVEAGPRRGPRPDGPPPGHGLPGLALLDLSAEQEAAVHELLQQHHKTLAPLHEQQRARREKIEALAAAASPDAAQIGQLVLEAHAARRQARAAREKLKESIGALLTPEQRELWARIEALHEKVGFGPGRGPGPRGDGFVPGAGPDE